MAESSIPLFCPSNPDEPNPALMHEYISIFLSTCSAQFPFVSGDAVAAGYMRSTLSPALANAIAAISVPLASSVAALAGKDLNAVSNLYLEAAKKALAGPAGAFSISMVEACLLVSQLDLKARRLEEHDMYVKRAIVMASQLKLDKEETITRPDLLPEQRQQLHALRVTLFRLLQDIKSRTGQAVKQ